MKSKKMIVVLWIVGLVVSGCSMSSKKPNRLPDDERSDWVNGQVAFYNTNLLLDSVITINDNLIATDSGKFQTQLQSDVSYDYQVQTLLGTYTGTQTYNRNDIFRIEIPAFSEWSMALFDEVALHPFKKITVRWPKGKQINVWIEPPSQDPVAQPRHVEMAKNAFREWEDVLHGAITFQFVPSKQSADIQVEFLPESEIGGYAGYCNRYWDSSTSLISAAQIEIAHMSNNIAAIDRIGVYRHEIGHCIGLSHSTNDKHLMYPIVSPSNSGITETEKNITRLIYSIPAGTPGFSSSSVRVSESHPHFQSYYDIENNLMIDHIPISLPPS